MGTELMWQCVGHNPTAWSYGRYDAEDNTLRDILAVIERKRSGERGWMLLLKRRHYGGVEPSRDTAMGAANAALARVHGHS